MQINRKGFPRPTLPMNGKNTPLPWVGGTKPEDGEWASTYQPRAKEAEAERLCIVCGLELSDDFIYMLVDSEISSDHVGTEWDVVLGTYTPSPTFVHPKCGQIASLFCPHLKREKYPAQTQNGRKLTHDQLKDLARKSDKPGES